MTLRLFGDVDAPPAGPRFLGIRFLVGFGISSVAYAGLALALMGQVRHKPWATSAFGSVHLLLTGAALWMAALHGSFGQRVALAFVVLAASLYLFGFVWFNTWGT